MQIGLRLLAGFIVPDSDDTEQSVQGDNVGDAVRPSVERDKVTIH